MNKLNEQYFQTRRNHERNYRNRKPLTWKRRILNMVITFVLYYILTHFYNYLSKRYEENKKEDMLQHQILIQDKKAKDTIQLKKRTYEEKNSMQ